MVPAVCSEQVVVSELLVPTPLESDMMSLVSPALLSIKWPVGIGLSNDFY